MVVYKTMSKIELYKFKFTGKLFPEDLEGSRTLKIIFKPCISFFIILILKNFICFQIIINNGCQTVGACWLGVWEAGAWHKNQAQNIDRRRPAACGGDRRRPAATGILYAFIYVFVTYLFTYIFVCRTNLFPFISLLLFSYLLLNK